jgi:hypothetical protein
MRREAYNVIVANPEFGSFTAQAPDEPLFNPDSAIALHKKREAQPCRSKVSAEG